ncbi:MAG: acylphosphatase [Bacteroidetes bacterium]|nr:acylphosphatase [Bacteroidota bacterium]
MSTTVHFIVDGKVQGVGFRRFVLHAANQLDLKGFVTNLEDGTIECMAQGDVSALTEFETLLRQGPRFALVNSVTCTDVEGGKQYTSFRIV